MGDFKGVSFIPAIKYIKDTYGQEGFEKVLEDLSEEDKTVICGKFTLMYWYSAKALINFIASADKILGKGDYQLCRTSGIKSAEGAFKGLYKMFLEFGKPHTIIRRAPQAWKLLNNTGDLELEMVEDKYVKGRIVNFDDYHKAHCQHLLGYFQKVLELSGAQNVQIKELQCRCDGASFCEFEVRW